MIYDENHISIEDDTDVAFTEDVLERYEAYGWHTQRVDWTRTGEYVEDVQELLRRAARREGRNRQAVHHLAAHHHRLPGAEEAEHRQDPRLGPGRRGSRGLKKVLGFDPEQCLPGRRGRPGPHPRGAGPRRRGPQRMAGSVRGVAVGQPRGRRPARARRGPEAPRRTRRRPAGLRSRQGRLHPRRVRQGPERASARSCPSCGAAPPTSPSPTTPPSKARPRSSRPPAQPRPGRATRTAGSCTSASANTPPRRS